MQVHIIVTIIMIMVTIVTIIMIMVTIVIGMMTLTVMYVVSMLHACITVMDNIGM